MEEESAFIKDKDEFIPYVWKYTYILSIQRNIRGQNVMCIIQRIMDDLILLGLPGLWSSVPELETGAPKLQNVSTGRVKLTRESN